MTPQHLHTLILIIVAIAAMVGGFFLGLVVLGKRDDEAIANAIKDCTRPEPHVCRVNGPCNGYPKENL